MILLPYGSLPHRRASRVNRLPASPSSDESEQMDDVGLASPYQHSPSPAAKPIAKSKHTQTSQRGSPSSQSSQRARHDEIRKNEYVNEEEDLQDNDYYSKDHSNLWPLMKK